MLNNILLFLASLLPDRFWLWASEFAAEECDRRADYDMNTYDMPTELREFLYSGQMSPEENFSRLEMEDGRFYLYDGEGYDFDCDYDFCGDLGDRDFE
jgi:hypothetical protein